MHALLISLRTYACQIRVTLIPSEKAKLDNVGFYSQFEFPGNSNELLF